MNSKNSWHSQIDQLVNKISTAKHLVVFTGAGMSVESGIPTFRGEDGIWSRYDPKILDIDYFYSHPEIAWPVIREIFYDFFGKAKPNRGHIVLGQLQKLGILKSIITQNIDNLHQEGGATSVIEFHGNSEQLVCVKCNVRKHVSMVDLDVLPVKCEVCHSVLKPDFVFFGEGIPPLSYQKSFDEARLADVVLIIGSTGEVMPAAMMPYEANKNGAFIIEINPESSNFTSKLTDMFIRGKAAEVLDAVALKMDLIEEK
jgi:NAD-dependent deacetylase